MKPGTVLMRPHRELPAEKQTLTELGQFTEKTLDTLQNCWLTGIPELAVIAL